MLLTMEHECNAKFELFPNPERIDKVIITLMVFNAIFNLLFINDI